jgi:hypothetical protein
MTGAEKRFTNRSQEFKKRKEFYPIGGGGIL